MGLDEADQSDCMAAINIETRAEGLAENSDVVGDKENAIVFQSM